MSDRDRHALAGFFLALPKKRVRRSNVYTVTHPEHHTSTEVYIPAKYQKTQLREMCEAITEWPGCLIEPYDHAPRWVVVEARHETAAAYPTLFATRKG